MPTSIRLAPETEKRLNELAARTGRTKAFYLRQAVEEHLDDMEDYCLASGGSGAHVAPFMPDSAVIMAL